MASKTSGNSTIIDVVEVSRGEAHFRLIGETPLIMESVGDKARRELLLPSGRKNAAERASTFKHDPYAEFLASAWKLTTGPTRLAMPATAFKDAVRTAALDLAGVSKTEIGRLTSFMGDMVPIWGIPELFMTIVRSADINHTPDVRTRAIIREWVSEVTVRFIRPKMSEPALARLLVAAGMTVGVGGWRQEKGSGNYGLWRVATPDDDETFQRIVREGSRAEQEAALASPACYDVQTAELLSWYDDAVEERRRLGAATPKTNGRSAAAEVA